MHNPIMVKQWRPYKQVGVPAHQAT